jgi:hypothetical protein
MATTQNQSWFSRNRKHLFLLLAIVTGLVIAVMGWHWTDTAETKFWQDTWVILAVACLVAWVGLWAYFWSKDKPRK